MYRRTLLILISFFALVPFANGEELYTLSENPLEISQPIVHIKMDDGRISMAVYSASDTKSELIKSKCYDAHPNWSPDYKKIVFTADCISGGEKFMESAEIYTVNRDGSGRTRLTHGGRNFVPRWSNNSKKIVFQSNRTDSEQIFTMDADGSNKMNISQNDLSDMQPDWSPIEDKIAFTSGKNFDLKNVYVMDSDGKNRKKLTNFEHRVDNPRWSPDGQRILFILNKNDRGQLYVMNSDGSELEEITPQGYSVFTAAWSQDGEKIAITKSSKEHGYNIEIIDIKKYLIYQAINEFSSAPDW